MYVYRSWALWMHAHTLTRTEEMLAIHSSLRLNHFQARAHTHTSGDYYVCVAVDWHRLAARRMRCLIHCLLLGLVHTTHRCVFFSPERRITYPTCPHRRTIFHSILSSDFVHFEDSSVHPFVTQMILIGHIKWWDFLFVRSKPKLNAKYERKAPAYLNILICCLAFYLVNDSKGLVGGTAEISTHPTIIPLAGYFGLCLNRWIACHVDVCGANIGTYTVKTIQTLAMEDATDRPFGNDSFFTVIVSSKFRATGFRRVEYASDEHPEQKSIFSWISKYFVNRSARLKHIVIGISCLESRDFRPFHTFSHGTRTSQRKKKLLFNWNEIGEMNIIE